jgi:hypothetical protein
MKKLVQKLPARPHALLNRCRVPPLKADPTLSSRYGGEKGRKARMRILNRRFLRKLVPRVLRTYSPWYTPHDIGMPERMKVLAQRFDKEAVSRTT